MKKLLMLLAVCVAPWAAAQGYPNCVIGQNFTPVAFAKETITVSSTALGFTRSVYDQAASTGFKAVMAFVTTETDAMRVWFDGSIPTAAIGHNVPAAGQVVVCSTDLASFRMIRVTNDVTVRVTYYRQP